MSTPEGLFTDGADAFVPKLDHIPLRDADAHQAGEGSIGDLVSDATTQISSLVRAEVELAKTELANEAKKGALGGGLFAVAGIIGLYSTFFFFLAVAYVLALWIPTWSAFLIVFVIMVALAALIALVGWRKVKKISMPEKTLKSVSSLTSLVPGRGRKAITTDEDGMFT